MMGTLDTAFADACLNRVRAFDPLVADGRVRSLVGILIEGEGISARLGSICAVEARDGAAFEAEVVGFRDDRFLLMPLANHHGVGPGARIHLLHTRSEVPAGNACLGRVLDGLGRPIDGGPPLEGADFVPLHRSPESAITRERVRRSLGLGVRAIDGLTAVGRGARIGIFAGSGVGKSTLLSQIARATAADVRVIALVGERRREVREFIERDLGDALAQSVVVVATSDEAPPLRTRAAFTATAIAESFRDQGQQVLLIMDSLTRFCTALREIGLAVGEPPTTRGYTPSVWSTLPRLLERAGTSECGGSVTGLYSVLVEGDDMNEPVSDAARSLLDGHITLSRALAEKGHYPAIDVLASVSRVMPDIVSAEHQALALRAREALAVYRDAEDLISIGAYVPGSNPAIDAAQQLHGPLRAFLCQGGGEPSSEEDARRALAVALGGVES
jgi:flagellum-specific ATP synthase